MSRKKERLNDKLFTELDEVQKLISEDGENDVLNREVKQKLVESVSLLDSFFNSPGAMRGVVEIEGNDIRHIADNAVSAEFFGRTKESMSNMLASEMGVDRYFIDLWIKYYEKSKQKKQQVNFEYEHKADKRNYFFSVTVNYLGESARGFSRYTYVLFDITEYKLAQKKLQKAYDDLDRRVEQRTTELAQSNEKLKKEIEERKQVQRNLKESQRILEESGRLARLGSWEWMIDTNAITWSDEMFRIFGYEPDAIYPNYDVFSKALHSDDRDRVLNSARRSVEKEMPYEEIYRIIRPDGAERVVHATGSVRRDDQNRAVAMVGAVLDITERKQAEEELKESEEKAKRIAEVNKTIAKIGRIISSTLTIEEVYDQFVTEVKKIIPFDRVNIGLINQGEGTYRIAYTSGLEIPERRKETIMPFPRLVREAIRRRSGVLLQPESEDEFIDDYPEALIPFRTGIRSTIVAPMISKGQVVGVLYFASSRSKAYSNSDLVLAENVASQIAGAISSAQLYDQIKETVGALRESEEKFKTVAEQSPNMIFINSKGKIVYANKLAEKIMGYKRDEFYSPDFDFLSIIAPESIEIVMSSFKKHMEGEEIDPYEYDLINRDGKKIEVVINTKLINFEGERAILGIVTDISKRKLIEKALKESEERFHLATKAGNVGVWDWDLNTGNMYIFPNLKNMLGYEDQEIRNHIEDWSKHVFYEDMEKVMKEANDCIDGTKEDYVIEHRMLHKDGSIRWFLTSGRVERDENGKAVRFVGTDTDITNQKFLEEKLRQAQKLESIGTLAGGIAHDFNNILSPIMIHSEMSMMELPPDNPVQHNLNEIYKAGERARDMVKQILAFSRKGEKDRVAIKMTPILKDVLKMLRSSIPTTIDIHQNLKADPDTVLADPTQIHQIMLNLGTNAAHAMREKGGALKVSLVHEDLDSNEVTQYHDLNPGSYLKLTMSDTGHGIDSENIQKIFEPYFTTKEPGEGTGMGLALVHGIVKSYGGDITVESELGKGTIFNVYLPRIETGVTTVEEHEVALPRGTERILFVDDEKVVVDAFQPMLESLGYEVTARTSSIEALEAFRNNPNGFDLAVTDMTMPNMTGKDLAKEMISIRSDFPIILCTGFSEQIDQKKAEEIGIRAFVMKPIVMGQIANTIREMLDKK